MPTFYFIVNLVSIAKSGLDPFSDLFTDNGDEINSTVGRAHALLLFNPDTNEVHLIDETSHFGTRIIRDNRIIDVPGRSRQGTKLYSGDEIYLGRALVRFNY